jgi:hypothetical protein
MARVTRSVLEKAGTVRRQMGPRKSGHSIVTSMSGRPDPRKQGPIEVVRRSQL